MLPPLHETFVCVEVAVTLNIVNTRVSDTTPHPPVPVTVIVKVMFPEVISAALGLYVGVAIVALLNVPVPDVDHKIDPLEAEPVKVNVVPAHIFAVAGPAFAVAGGDIVSTNESEIDSVEQAPEPVTVIVNVTFVLLLSAELGVKIVLSVFKLLKVPLPVLVQLTEPLEDEPLTESV